MALSNPPMSLRPGPIGRAGSAPGVSTSLRLRRSGRFPLVVALGMGNIIAPLPRWFGRIYVTMRRLGRGAINQGLRIMSRVISLATMLSAMLAFCLP